MKPFLMLERGNKLLNLNSSTPSRSGVEGTISQATRAFGMRRCRYRGFEKTRLQHIITAAAMNLVRIWQWWTEANNFGKSISRFAALAV
ncbi:MAG: transposase [Cyanobacteria bacterium P01_D01_bin.116]